MAVLIADVEANSPAKKAGIQAGDVLLSVNGHGIHDVLDYRFYMLERVLTLTLRRERKTLALRISKREEQDLGLVFDTYLMDKQHTCKNKCVFCFVDQMPKGMRKSLYFKDDDSRMSFLFGNYITLTNLTDRDVQRMISMHISPVNVSVHATDPALRMQLMKNPRAGESLKYLSQLTAAGIQVNTQLVLCPGLNDGAYLQKSLEDLAALGEHLQSIACVPVGLTNHRRGLPKLERYTEKTALDVVQTVEDFGRKMLEERGERVAYAADEFYLLAKRPIPSAAFYEDFSQLENGVGLVALLQDEFWQALEEDDSDPAPQPAELSIATGVAAYPLLRGLAGFVQDKYPHIQVHIYAIQNDFFGHSITVAGLVTGQDLAAQLKDKPLGSRLLIPAVMLRRERDAFLDDMTPEQLSQHLGVPVTPVENDGALLYHTICGRFHH